MNIKRKRRTISIGPLRRPVDVMAERKAMFEEWLREANEIITEG